MLEDVLKGFKKMIIETANDEEVVEITEEEIIMKDGYKARLIP